MIKHQSISEYDWHRKRAKLITMTMKRPERVIIMEATYGTLSMKINDIDFILIRPPLKNYD